MRYRVIRDLGNSDFPVGSSFDGSALDPGRIERLIDQHRIEPVIDIATASDAAERAAQDAAIAALTAENEQLRAALSAALAGGEKQGGDAGPNLAEMKADELRALAEERGIERHKAMTKPQLIAALTPPEGGASDE